MWYELGVLIEFNKNIIVIKENYDYFDSDEFDRLFTFRKSYLLKTPVKKRVIKKSELLRSD
jgi:hypothetical protein